MRGSALMAVALVAVLAGCGTENDGPERAQPAPGHILEATGSPGEPVVLSHTAEEGDVVQVIVKPLPMTSCGNEKLVLEGPGATPTDLTTLDPATRIEADGEWTWTFEPCPGDTTTYTLAGTPMRQFILETDGEPVTLERHATYEDAATFVVPKEGRTILLGTPRIVLDPHGERLPFWSGGGDRLAFDGATQAGTYTTLGTGVFRVVRPVEATAELGEPLELEPAEGDVSGEYEVTFTVPEDTWLTAPLRDWETAGSGLESRTIERVDGSTEGTREGGGLDGLWHLGPGDYVARVFPPRPDSAGTLTLTEMSPTEITSPGDHTLTTGPDGEPGVALFDLPGSHRISVLEDQGTSVPWLLTWHKDAEPEPCVGAASCMAQGALSIPSSFDLPMSIRGQGYLALTSSDGEQHTVTVRIG